MKANLPDKDGGNVISIEVFRRNRQQRKIYEQCTHGRISVDTALVHLTCLDCGALLNPVEWVASLADEWDRITRMTDRYKEEVAKFEKRTRTKCIHCEKFTPVSR